ncbi:ATP-binding cassette domain-containing protein [Ferrimonas balearica]|uniref:ATP-binding cassette domain-containing protein n=1 Tax=Ferrimonas balearica TaxID=44012 RepID=UPI001F348E5B|nr:ATP-binding cassette domain-containing protein [Ferrimonas balearica]MBY6094885.1 ATP-binding cassette domain-containing protein [Ferrimonas balearica]
MPLFSLNRATLRQGNEVVLQSVSLVIQTDERVAILGPSGVGKTTLLNHLYQQAPQQVALCPQTQGLVEPLSVYHNIYMGELSRHSSLYNLINLLLPLPKPRRTIGALADSLGLAGKLMTPVALLSGGQRQRTALGRALHQARPTLLADEPVSALDPVQAKAVLQRALEQHRGAVVALHDVALARACFDRVVGLSGGRVLFDKPAEALSEADLAQLYR